MGGACSMHGKREMFSVFWSENLKRRDCLVDPCFDRRIILE
jgi:hypothetical protein